MNTQLTMDYSKKATERGIKKAVDHANQVHSQWSETAYDFLRIYLRHHRTQLFTHRAIGPRYDNH